MEVVYKAQSVRKFQALNFLEGQAVRIAVEFIIVFHGRPKRLLCALEALQPPEVLQNDGHAHGGHTIRPDEFEVEKRGADVGGRELVALATPVAFVFIVVGDGIEVEVAHEIPHSFVGHLVPANRELGHEAA